MNNLVLNRIYRAQPQRRAKIYIGGLDATNFADAQLFSSNFRRSANPSQTNVINVQNILSYETEPDGNGRLNVEMEIQGEFEIPISSLSNYGSRPISIGRIRYLIDEQQLITGVGPRALANNPLQFVSFRNLKRLDNQWARSSSPNLLDLEGLEIIDDFAFGNYRNGTDIINIRNATILDPSPDSDSVFRNYNLNGYSGTLKKIYVHHSMETIDNGQPFKSLRQAINRGADVKFVSDTTSVPPKPTGVSIGQVTSNTVEFVFNNIPEADFYEVFKTNYDSPPEQFFPIGYINNTSKVITGLESGKFYTFKLVTRDVNYNKSEGSKIIGVITQ